MQITPNLWFDTNAEEAVNFYLSIFKNSKINTVSHYTEAGHDIHKMPAGMVLTIEFELNGQKFLALNGGPVFKFNEAVPFAVPCETQDEIDYYCEKLGQDGDPKFHECGWLKDKYGLSWQIVPSQIGEWISGDRQKANAVLEAIHSMKKLDIAKLKSAYEGAA